MKILFFAGIADLAGTTIVYYPTPKEPIDIKKIKESLYLTFPSIRGSLDRCLVAVNYEYASDDTKVSEQDEIAFFPTVSGG